MRKTAWLLCAAFLSSGVFAQDGPPRKGDGRDPAQEQASAEERRKMEKFFAEQQREMDKRMQEDLERLKKTDPEGYRRQKESIDRNKAIQGILADFQKGKKSEAEARRALIPLVKPEMDPMARDADRRIADLEKQLAFWKQVKKNPEVLSQRQIDSMLGKGDPGSSPFGPAGFNP